MKFAELLQVLKTEFKSYIATAVVLGIALSVFLNLEQNAARSWDIQWGYYAIITVLLIAVGAFAWRAKEYFLRIKENIPKLPILAMVGVVILALGLFVTNNIHKQHRVLSDENSWTSMALQMHFEQSGGVCNQGYWVDGVLNCTDEVNNFKGKTMALFESVLFVFMEPNRDTALALNYPLYLMSLLFFFIALYRLTSNAWVSIAAMTFLGAMPIFMMQAQTATTEVLYVFLLSCLLLFYSLVPPTQVAWRHVLLYTMILGLFSGTRQETLFCFVPFALYYHKFLRARTWHLPLFTALVILASWPAVNTMAAYRGYDFQGGQHEAHSFDNLWYNLRSNLDIMINGDLENGLLKNPFYSLFTIILLVSSAWLFIRLFFEKSYRYPAVLLGLFHLQSFVILYNVSGTFEIDINQRYVLVALPTFAFLMAWGLYDFLNVVPSATSMLRKKSAPIVAVLAIAISGYLTLANQESFQGNMLYFKNKLLTEEDFLNTELKKYPPNSIFLYARPWQMLCSGFNAYSESTFLSWSEQEYAKWKEWSGNNIYLVRGQDGYGSVDQSSRVVGFKTTDPIERILEEYANQLMLVNSKDFGYPLTITKLIKKKGRSPFAEGLVLETPHLEIDQNAEFPIRVRKNYPDTLSMTGSLNGVLIPETKITENIQEIKLPKIMVGINQLDLVFVAPNGDSLLRSQDFFMRSETARLLSALPLVRKSQEWGEPRWAQTVEGKPLQVNKRRFSYGYGSHANSLLALQPLGKYSRLHTWVGLDDESACGDGAVWIVRGDGKELWRSTQLTALMLDSVSINIAGVQELELETNRLTNNLCDHANWLNSWIE